MKQILILSILLLTVVVLTQAQDENPYSEFGYEGKVLKIPQGNYGTLRITTPKKDADYQPFGMTKAQGATTSGGYRYGFNGMEKDDEMKGMGNSYDFGARLYDSRLGRWLSQDNLSKPFITPYNSMSNDPITRTDPDGNTDFYAPDGTLLGHDNNYGNGKVAIVHDIAMIDRIQNNAMNVIDLPETSYRELPPYGHRREIYDEVQKKYYDENGNMIAFSEFEIGGTGIIHPTTGEQLHIMGDYGNEGEGHVDVLKPAEKLKKYRDRASTIPASSFYRNGQYNNSKIQQLYTWHTHLVNNEAMAAQYYPSGLNGGDKEFANRTNTNNHLMLSVRYESVHFFSKTSPVFTSETEHLFDQNILGTTQIAPGSLILPDATTSFDFFFNVRERGEAYENSDEFVGPRKPQQY